MEINFLELAQVKPGAYDLNIPHPWWRFKQQTERGGWLTVRRLDDGSTDVMWTTHSTYHWPHGRWGCARSLTIAKDGALIAYYESARSMWLKWGYGRGGESELQRAIDFGSWAQRRLSDLNANLGLKGREKLQ